MVIVADTSSVGDSDGGEQRIYDDSWWQHLLWWGSLLIVRLDYSGGRDGARGGNYRYETGDDNWYNYNNEIDKCDSSWQ